MPLKRIIGPTTQCVSVAEVKEFLRIQGTTAEDVLLHGMIKAAEGYAENYTKRAINRQQWELRLDDFPSATAEIELPRPPLTTLSSEVAINYIEDTTVGNTTTVPTTGYTIDYYSEPAIIYPSYDNDWPDDVRDENNAVRITYYSGYANPSAVPQEIKNWVMLRVGAMYEHRESVFLGSWNQLSELPRTYVDGLLDPYVVDANV